MIVQLFNFAKSFFTKKTKPASVSASILDKYIAAELGEKTFDDVARRVANAIMPHDPEPYYEAITKFLFLPNTPTLANAGVGNRNLTACHVIEIQNSIKGIMNAAALCADIFKSGGGVGINPSALSPMDTPLSTKGVASGAVSFLSIFDIIAEVIKQGGIRRAAIMVLMDASHQDIMHFIRMKNLRWLQRILISMFGKETLRGIYEHMNLSVAIANGPDSVAPDVWREIVSQASKHGEPGVVFLDTVNRDNPTLSELGTINSVNACGEVPLYNYGSCTLGAVNLNALVTELGNYAELKRVVGLAVEFLDRVIDVNYYPDIRIAEATRKTRDIGIGVCGFDDMLRKFGVAWNTQEARNIASDIACVMRKSAKRKSAELARLKSEYMPGMVMRNRVLLSIAPTGHRAVLAGVSPSIYADYLESLEYSIEDHLLMVWAWQMYIDNAISYTLSRYKGENDADKIYRMAYDLGLKTMSVYTAGSRRGEPMKAKSALARKMNKAMKWVNGLFAKRTVEDFGSTGCKDGTCSL